MRQVKGNLIKFRSYAIVYKALEKDTDIVVAIK